MTDLPLTGACGCGAVRFEIDAPLTGIAYCHCTRCQRRTGTAASANARVEPGTLRVVAGEEHLRAWEPEGGGSPKVFCAACGSALFSRHAATGEVRGVRMGALDHAPALPVVARQFVASAVIWEPVPDDGAPRYEGRMPESAWDDADPGSGSAAAG